uniref:11-beta-hydroxysteroid dehydrogenase type 2 n=1 Tax=Oncorhynchus tshawytscha TaxID=74940 RepID=A0AAZ3SBC1_ONCTS
MLKSDSPLSPSSLSLSLSPLPSLTLSLSLLSLLSLSPLLSSLSPLPSLSLSLSSPSHLSFSLSLSLSSLSLLSLLSLSSPFSLSLSLPSLSLSLSLSLSSHLSLLSLSLSLSLSLLSLLSLSSHLSLLSLSLSLSLSLLSLSLSSHLSLLSLSLSLHRPALPSLPFFPGCDTGFGKAAVRRLDAQGFEVFATVLDLCGEGARELQKTCSSRLTLLQVDITQPEQVQQALLDTKAKLGLRGLWGLVNNAGVCVNFGDAELSLMSNYRGCMEVNFFGTLNVTKTFLPLLRQAKGRIVTISSPAGEQPFPCLAAYGASKAALNLFINTLRHEMEPWGSKCPPYCQSGNQEYWESQYKSLIHNLSTKELFQHFAQSANEDLSPVINTISEALYFPLRLSDKFLQRLFVQKKIIPRALRKENNNNNNNINSNNNVEKIKK